MKRLAKVIGVLALVAFIGGCAGVPSKKSVPFDPKRQESIARIEVFMACGPYEKRLISRTEDDCYDGDHCATYSYCVEGKVIMIHMRNYGVYLRNFRVTEKCE